MRNQIKPSTAQSFGKLVTLRHETADVFCSAVTPLPDACERGRRQPRLEEDVSDFRAGHQAVHVAVRLAEEIVILCLVRWRHHPLVEKNTSFSAFSIKRMRRGTSLSELTLAPLLVFLFF